MPPLLIVPYYAAALAVLFIVLSMRVLLARRRLNVGFGAAGIDDLERRIRVHANFAEYVPFALILLLIDEARGAPSGRLHMLCACLLIGRLVHALGLSRSKYDMVGRIGGVTGTMIAITGAVLLILISKH